MNARTVLAAGFAALVLGCSSSPSEPTTGTLMVVVSTQGGAQDADGYLVEVEDGPSKAIGSNASVTLESLEAGAYRVTLGGLDADCRIAGTAPRSVTVVASDTAQVDFVVICPSEGGELEVTVETTGTDLDPNGYSLSLGESQGRYIAATGNTLLRHIPAGEYSIGVFGIERNCTASPSNPTSVVVSASQRATLRLAFSCSNQHGSLRVKVTATGAWQDADWFVISLDGIALPQLPDSSASVARLLAGDHVLELDDLDPECVVEGTNPRTVRIVAGETAQVTFTVRCTPPPPTTLVFNVTTTGGDLDTDGYIIEVLRCPYYYYYGCEYSASQRVPANGSVSFTNLRPGTFDVSISGLSSNCVLIGTFPSPMQVNPPGATVAVTVHCTANADLGRLTVSVATTGTDIDPGYAVMVTPTQATQRVTSNGSVTFAGLPPGVYSVQLFDVASNCSSAGTTTATVPAGGTAVASFSVVCRSLPTLNVTVTTFGGGTDANGYRITLEEDAFYSYYRVTSTVSANGTATFRPPSAGSYFLTLSDLDGNCTSAASAGFRITVGSGVTNVPITVTCTP